jgi:hypothetical protein
LLKYLEITGARNIKDLIRKIIKWWKSKENNLEEIRRESNKKFDPCIAMAGDATGL